MLVYSGLQGLAAFNGSFQNDKIHRVDVVKIFNINPPMTDSTGPVIC